MSPELFDMLGLAYACLLSGFVFGVLFACKLGEKSRDYGEFANKSKGDTTAKTSLPLNAAPGHVHKSYAIYNPDS